MQNPSRFRRQAVHAILLMGMATVIPGFGLAHAQGSADRIVRIVVPFGPGGGSDVLARLIQPRLAETLRSTVIIENRPGAGGTLGAGVVAKAAPDGTTLLLTDASVATIAPALYAKLTYATKDLTPVISLAQFPNLLVAPTRLRANTLAELVAEQRSHPQPLSIASSGNGTSTHLTAELLKSVTHLPLTHVPYKGSGAAISDTAGGQVDLLFTGYATVAQLIKAGRLKPIAVTSPKRLPELPQVPTVAESGFPGFESWIAQVVFAPAGTPREVVQKLNVAIADALRQPDVAAKMRQQGLEPYGNSPDEFSTWIDGQSRLWARVIRESGAKPE
ncbi:Bug family tripartite tricarboxylate transporter substrate binding protein [Cupriavidus sp. 2TAF22]|uniref:Bug family tripartite tricarboxylate transporter substrate binding protein n=1 Tax=unclassified Cupriavidus TaxID=2640874 RepID=UPI003F90BBB3